MKLIIYPLKDNNLGIIEPNLELTLEQAISNMPNDLPIGVVNSSEIYYSVIEAYKFQDKKAVVNISKAKEIWLNHYRAARTPLLAALDLEYMRADEQDNLELKKEIAAKKQALRDVTKTELPDDLEGIKNTWPEILGSNPFNK